MPQAKERGPGTSKELFSLIMHFYICFTIHHMELLFDVLETPTFSTDRYATVTDLGYRPLPDPLCDALRGNAHDNSGTMPMNWAAFATATGMGVAS